MYIIAVDSHFASSHQIVGYDGKCSNMHGHTWKIKVEVKTDKVDEIGICYDFKSLKQLINTIVDDLDHQNLNQLPPFRDNNPTAENIAHFLYHAIKKILPDEVEMHQITVWESEKYSVIYKED
ncbi:MAG: 6-carboxytetrahydropterin synthase QueD [Fidelibacterota bacterium]